MVNMVVSFVVPVISVLLSFLIGLLTNKINKSNEADKEIYQNLCVPYIQFLVRLSPIWKEYSTGENLIPTEIILQHFDLVMNNVQYLSPNASNKLQNLYKSLLNVLSVRDGEIVDESGKTEALHIILFELITDDILKQTSQISRKLRYPDPTKSLSSTFSN